MLGYNLLYQRVIGTYRLCQCFPFETATSCHFVSLLLFYNDLKIDGLKNGKLSLPQTNSWAILRNEHNVCIVGLLILDLGMASRY